MKKNFILSFFLFAVMASPAQVIRVATYQYADNDRIKNIQPFADYLKNKYGYETAVKSYPTVHAFIEAIQKNEVDIAFINSFGYLLLEASGKQYPMHPVAALAVRDDAKDNYKTALVISSHLKAKRLADLKSLASTLRLALVNKGSTSGNLVPRLALSSIGIKHPEKSFASFEYTQTHAAALQAVVSGHADVAAMGNSEYDKYLAQDSTNKKKIKLLWLSPEIPLGPVLFNNRFGSAVGRELLTAILDLHQQDAAALDAIKAGWSEAKQTTHFVKITPSHYDPLKKINKDSKEFKRILKAFTE
jgi:phosphate/phosphite/phosphonate ABC transporter binding protein